MSSRPLVSICIPTYNRAAMVEAAIRSALAQTYEHVRVVVIDNHSTDGTVKLLEYFQSAHPDRFRFVVNDENIGLHGNFQRCVDLAEGPYFKILCSDDVAYPTLVEKQVNVLESHPSVVAVTARRRRRTDNLLFRLYDPVLQMHAGLWKGGDAVRYVFRVANLIGGPVQVLARTKAYRSVPLRRDDVVGNMFDVMPVLRLLAEGHDLYVLDEVLCDYNSQPSSYGAKTLADPAVQDYYFALREEQARDPAFAAHLRLPADLEASRRNAALILLLAGFSSTFPSRDRETARSFFDYLERRSGLSLLRVLRWPMELAYRIPSRRGTAKARRERTDS